MFQWEFASLEVSEMHKLKQQMPAGGPAPHLTQPITPALHCKP